MKKPVTFLIFVLSLCLVAIVRPLYAADSDAVDAMPSMLVTPELLRSRIAETEADAKLPDALRHDLLGFYRKALSYREEASASAARASEFERAARVASEQARNIREEIDSAGGTDPLATLSVSLETPLEQIEQQLLSERANWAAANARRADFERRLNDELRRPTAVIQHLAEIEQRDGTEDFEVTVAGEHPALAQAMRWVVETRDAATSREIRRLDQELISQPARVELLRARIARATLTVSRMNARIRALSDLVNSRRQLEAEQAKEAAETMRRELASLDPLLVRVADQNAALTGFLNTTARRLNSLNLEQALAEQVAARTAADFEDAQATLESSGLAEGLGRLLVAQRQALPDIHTYINRSYARTREIAATNVRRLQHRDEARRISDLDEATANLEVQLTGDNAPELRDKLRTLVETRQTLLQRTLEVDEFYLEELRDLRAAELKVLEVVTAYDEFLSEHLLWLRSADTTRLSDLLHLPGEIGQLLSPALWSGLNRAFVDQLPGTPLFWVALLVAAALWWKRRALLSAIEATSARVGKARTDRFAYTFRALALTLIAAAPLPLILTITGWQFQYGTQSTDVSYGVGSTLMRSAGLLYMLLALRLLCMPGGVAAGHFRWPEASTELLRLKLGFLIWVLVPAPLVGRLAIDLNPGETGGMIAKLGFLVAYISLTVFFYSVLHPDRGTLARLRSRQDSASGLFFRGYHLWFLLLMAIPLGLAALMLTGYVYSALTLTSAFLSSAWMIFGLFVVYSLAVRWLLVARRRLAYEAAVEHRRAAIAAKQTSEPATGTDDNIGLQVGEEEVDLDALDAESRKLIKLVIIFGGLVALYLIWSPLLPALRLFDGVTLWYHTVVVSGEDARLPITLADLGLALFYAIGTGVLARQLPAVLEIILLHRFHMSSGSRYTMTTLSTYAIVLIGILLVFNTIGAQWSQLQWLVAALGIGIGFGLQEIVANFISGLIILFERPIRVGDLVTIGDTSGVVTRIQIRATTIRDWDRKELLVPNKEFITGRLLNWTLSDEVIRVVIRVGITYGSDVDKAMALLLEAAGEDERVRKEPAPSVVFNEFGDNSLNMALRVFITSPSDWMPLTTDLHRAINRKFNEAGIVIAFPQRDVHMDASEPFRISLEDARKA